jgi:hypothetical protein
MAAGTPLSQLRARPESHPAILIAAALGLAAAGAGAAPNYDVPLDRPYSLRNAVPFTLELENHRQIESGKPRSYTFPRACLSGTDSSQACGEPTRLKYVDADQDRNLFGAPILGYEYRYLSENVQVGEGGLNLRGNSGPLSFYLDARMFTEAHEPGLHPSYDREFVERQSAEDSHVSDYSSYSRYRANLSYDVPWGRFTVARDAAHWGPGMYGNLVFNQQAVPFDQLVFSTRLGPFSVRSLYGRLTVSDAGQFPTDSATRSVYAHRYEYSPSPQWTFGISEELILYDREAPFAFTPIVPLFIAKAYASESHNNGNIAGDVSYVFPGLGSLYTEFLVDDLKSPSGLFDDLWANKWAWLAGAHFIFDHGPDKTGLVAEYSRVEPWVYTHYIPKSAQAANQGVPLGNPDGPNSQRITGKGYWSRGNGWYASAMASAVWKGEDKGSSLSDTLNEHSKAKKHFLSGVDRPEWAFTPSIGYAYGYLVSSASAELGDTQALWIRLGIHL